MHASHAVFLDALAAKRRLRVRFVSRKLGKELETVCAPLDFGPLRGAVDRSDHYQLWDLQGKRKPFNLALHDAEILSIEPLDESFDPAEIITWAFKKGAWAIARDWGEFS